MRAPSTPPFDAIRLVLRHTAGSRRGEVDVFFLAADKHLVVGRDAQADLGFDAVLDDLVSRHHARIERTGGGAAGFTIVDLESRNGTFVNDRRVRGSAQLHFGDRVRLGPGGPVFELVLPASPAPRPWGGRLAAARTVLPALWRMATGRRR